MGTFIRRYIVERSNKAEIRPEEQSERRRVVGGGGGGINGMKYGWKGRTDRNRHKERIKRSGQARLVLCQIQTVNIPTV